MPQSRLSKEEVVQRGKSLYEGEIRAKVETEHHGRIQGLETELIEIDESLKWVEQLVIADATVVATTLTRAYLRDAWVPHPF